VLWINNDLKVTASLQHIRVTIHCSKLLYGTLRYCEKMRTTFMSCDHIVTYCNKYGVIVGSLGTVSVIKLPKVVQFAYDDLI